MKQRYDFPNYRLIEQLYAGSRTLVYRAIRKVDQHPVVIKLLKHEYPGFSELVQFRNQYAITKNLDIPGIIQPYSLEPYRNGYALVMEDFNGISLRDWMKQGSREIEEMEKAASSTATIVSPARVASSLSLAAVSLSNFFLIALQVVETLHLLHQQRVIHKDIKPSNILIHPQSRRVKLLDFSISTLLPKEIQEIQNSEVLEGTLAYLSPEQTGRMNRGIDYRSDFYALGVTFYELLTGQLPFQSDDPMELVHCHLAKQPPVVHHLNPLVPPMLSEMIAKLMAKNAEERYQSALGLKHDLEACFAQHQETGEIEKFALGERDLCDRFLIPEKLYGREQEVVALLAAFDRVAGSETVRGQEHGSVGAELIGSSTHSPIHLSTPSRSELMLVAGFSGIGKTAVVNEVHKPIVRQRGYFIKGKFDQFQRSVPFSALVQAFRHLMAQLLSESDVQLAKWQALILSALGENAQVIIDVVPELERIIGSQPAVPELTGSAAQNRFNLVFQKFLRVFTTADHPLVMFIDDLQWADAASLNLIRLLMSETETGYLLILGAYRDNEVFAAHPLMLTLAEIRQSGSTVNTITLAPLSADNVNQLVADTLSCTQQCALPLTELVYQKTQGNPFFTNQFLKVLHEEGLITFDSSLGYWQCAIAQVRSLALTDDVVQFMALQLQKLPTATQQMLELAACVGAQFDLETLAIVSERTPAEVAMDLWQALQDGLLLPINEVYKFYQVDSTTFNTQHSTLNTQHGSYRFLHDRVQQAAYSLIAAEQRPSIHLKIGQLLLNHTAAIEQDHKLFDIVNHLHMGARLVTQPAEREKIARLSVFAAKKAKSATAYASALTYATTGIALLPSDCWQRQYELTLMLHELAADCAFLARDLEQMEQWAEIVLQQAKTLFDQIKIYEIKIQTYILQHQPLDAIALGNQVLNQFEIQLPDQPTQEMIQQAFQQTVNQFSGKSIEALLNLPLMAQPAPLAAIRIAASVAPAVYFAAPQLYPFLILSQVNASIQHGNAPLSAFFYASYGLLLNGVLEDMEAADRAGKLALGVLEKLNAKDVESRTRLILGALVMHGTAHLQTALQCLRESYQIGLETGDIEFAGHAAFNGCQYAYFSGQELATLEQDIQAYSQMMLNLKQVMAFNYCQLFRQVALNLLGTAEDPCLLVSDAYDEVQVLPQLLAVNDQMGLHFFYLHKLILGYLFGETQALSALATQAKQYLAAGVGFITIPIFYFYDSLAALAEDFGTDPKSSDRLQRVAENQAKLQKWAHHAPMNHLHKWHLVEAETQRVLGNRAAAIDHYDRAIAAAKANKYMNEAALANELAAKFYLRWGKERIAQEYLTEAYYDYGRWGAKAKIVDLERRYPQLLAPILQQRQQLLTTTDTILVPASHSTQASSSSSVSETLDLATILKVSQALSSEIELEKLLTALLQAVIENAGAEKCVLMLLADKNADQPNSQRLLVQGCIQAGAKPIVLQQIAIEDSHEIPLKLIYAVKHSLQSVVLVNAAADPTLATDPYILQHQPKSVLCSPILNRGAVAGMLYLENNLVPGVFTHDRVELLNLLCAQAAISLENARLYQQSQTYAQQIEHALREQQKLAAVVQASTDFVGIATLTGQAIYVNPAGQQLLGIARDTEISNLHLRDFHTPEELERLEQEVLPGVMQHGVEYGELSFRHFQTGELIPTDYVLFTIKDPFTQQPLCLASISRDMRERKRVEKSLRLTQFAINHASIPVWWITPSGQIAYVNEAACRDLGYSQDEILQKYVWDFNPDALAEVWGDHWQELKEKGSFVFEARNVSQSGNCYPVEVTVNYVELDGEEYNCAFVQNISDRKRIEAERQQAELAMRLSEERYRCLITTTTHLLWTTDAEGQVVEDLPSWRAYTGQTFDEIKGVGTLQALHPDDYDRVVRVWLKAVQTKSAYKTEYRVRSKDGIYRYFDVHGVPVLDADGSIREWIGACTDIDDHKRAEASQARLVAILEAATDIIGMADAEGNNLYLNKAGQQTLGISADQVDQFHIMEVLAPSMREMTQTVALPTAIQTGSWSGESILITAEKEEIPISQVIVAHKNEHGQIDVFSSIMRDIRDRKQTEIVLREKEQFLRSIYDGAETVIFVLDVLDDGNFRYAGWNTAAEKVTGVRSADIAGKTLFEAMGEDGKRLQQRFAETVITGMSISYEEHLTFQGQETWWYATVNPIKNAAGQVYRLIGTTFQITDRKQAEITLQEKEQFLRSIYDGVETIIVVVDVMEDGSFRYAGMNAATERLVGISESDALGKTPIEAYGEQTGKAIQDLFAKCVQSGVPISSEDPFIFDGEEKWFLTTHNPIKNEAGQIYRIVTTAVDVIDRKRAEAQLSQRTVELEQTLKELQRTQTQMVQSEKMSGLGQLVAGVAHEINNPVNFIYGNLNHATVYTKDLLGLVQLYQQLYPTPHPKIQHEAEVIDLDFLIEDLPKLLTSMKVGADRIQKIVASLRNFSRMDEAEMKEVNIHDGIDSTLMILQHRLKARSDHPGVEIIKAYGELPLVECYAGQLNQVFMNLLSNAIDALEEADSAEAITIPTITIQTEAVNAQQVAIRITDSGPGIPVHVQRRLFDPFFTTKPVGKGTGMGLSISYQIVAEKHKGSLKCVSQPGQGATFVITIPIRQS